MFPGIDVPAEGLPSFVAGEPWAVKVPGNPAPIAVCFFSLSFCGALVIPYSLLPMVPWSGGLIGCTSKSSTRVQALVAADSVLLSASMIVFILCRLGLPQ